MENYVDCSNRQLLPDSILWRKKEAFSDGVSKTSRSLYEIIQEYTNEIYKEDIKNNSDKEKIKKIFKQKSMTEMEFIDDHLLPETSEQYYYRSIFEKEYENMGKILPYFWMPKYVIANDASARTLNIYNETNTEEMIEGDCSIVNEFYEDDFDSDNSIYN